MPTVAGIAYLLGAKVAFFIGTLSDKIFAPFWAPNIVLFCAFLLVPPRRWWPFILATFAAHVVAELGVGMTAPRLLVAFGTNCLVAIINALAVRRFLEGHPWFGTLRKAILYIVITAIGAPAIAALAGAFVQVLGTGIFAHYGMAWAQWYASNALGSLTLGPIAMIWLCERRAPHAFRLNSTHVEAGLLTLVLLATCVIAFDAMDGVQVRLAYCD
jgi:integral membrane sensor domain MASE1